MCTQPLGWATCVVEAEVRSNFDTSTKLTPPNSGCLTLGQLIVWFQISLRFICNILEAYDKGDHYVTAVPVPALKYWIWLVLHFARVSREPAS